MSEDKVLMSGGEGEILSDLYKISSSGILILDQAGKVIHANGACLSALGLSRLDLIFGMDFFSSAIISESQLAELNQGGLLCYSKKIDFSEFGLESSLDGPIELIIDISVFDDDGRVRYFVQLRRSDLYEHCGRNLYEKLQFEKLINAISMKLLRSGQDSIDEDMKRILGQIAEFVDADRVYIVSPKGDSNRLECRYEWHRNSAVSPIELFADVSHKDYHWIFDRISKGPLLIEQTSELQGENIGHLSKIIEAGVESIVVVELDFDKSKGFLAYDSTHSRGFSDSLVGYIELLSGIIANVLTRLDTENTLQAMNEQFGLFMENLPAGTFIRTFDGEMIYANKALGQMLGQQNLHGLDKLKIPVEISGRIEKLIGKVIEDGQCNSVETFQDAKGNQKSVVMALFTIPRGESEILIGGVLRDLSDVQVLEKDLEQAENRCAQALAMAKMGFWSVDYSLDEPVMTFSPEMKKIYGIDSGKSDYSKDEVLEMIHPAEREMVMDNFRIAMKNHMPFWLIHRAVLPDGKKLFVQQKGQGIYDSQGNLTGATGLVQDVTEQITANQKVQYQRELLGSMVDNIPMAIIAKEFKEQGEYIIFNQAAQALTGLKPVDIIGKTESDLVSESTLEDWLELDRQAIESGHRKTFDNVEVEFSSGQKCLAHGIKIPIYDVEGNASMMIMLLQESGEAVEKVEELKDVAAPEIFYDVGNVNNLCQLIFYSLRKMMADKDNQTTERLEQLEKAAGQVRNISRRLLIGNEESLRGSDGLLRLSDVEQNVLGILEKAVGPDKIQLDFSSKIGPLRMRSEQLLQILVNLSRNADQAMDGNGEIFITAKQYDQPPIEIQPLIEHPADSWACITVADTGNGIPNEHADKIYEPFFTTKKDDINLGIGLTVAKEIVEAAGGHLTLKNNVTSGAVFMIALPLAAEVEEKKPEPKKIMAKKETILLAEDDELVRNLIVRYLSKAGYKVLVASNGVDAIDFLDANKANIDLLVLDVIMPIKSGKDVYDYALEQGLKIPVIFCSGYSDFILDEEYLKGISATLLNKPCPPSKLLEAIERLLGSDE